uniref:PiggyBac transposable element-derived protein domain-containing protein n=2 Tax=Ixodes scapularis TaxID=6945 RepID=A0A1S4LVC0_IXOSC
ARSRERDWIPTTKEEIKLLLGVWILQGIVQKPTLNSYFTQQPLLETPIFYQLFTEKRFCLLLKYLHFADNGAAVPEDMLNPRLHKIRPILEHLVEKFQQAYTPQRDICIDESLLLWKGRLGWKLYIPMKRARFGMESFRLCESASGYVWNIFVYTGKTTKY